MNYIEERKLLVEYGKIMSSEGLSTGTSGNLSIYNSDDKLVMITPSGINYFKTKPEDIVVMTLDGDIIEGDRKPSSEWHLHTLFYKNKDDARAIVHTHSIYCTTFAALRMPILPVHYVIADTKCMEVPCAPYERFGTEKLAKAAVKAAGKSDAVLLANHGLVTCGKDLQAAYGLAREMEYIAEIQYRAMCIGKPVLLNENEINEVMEAFKSYGQKKEK